MFCVGGFGFSNVIFIIHTNETIKGSFMNDDSKICTFYDPLPPSVTFCPKNINPLKSIKLHPPRPPPPSREQKSSECKMKNSKIHRIALDYLLHLVDEKTNRYI